jgi:transcriptional regulator with XRE-family HTH domain
MGRKGPCLRFCDALSATRPRTNAKPGETQVETVPGRRKADGKGSPGSGDGQACGVGGASSAARSDRRDGAPGCGIRRARIVVVILFVLADRGDGEDMSRDAKEDGPHPVDRHVGRRVSEKRIGLGYNQSDLGRALGLTFQQIQKYEKGANRISASKLWDIARFFKVDIGYFFEGLGSSVHSGAAENEGGVVDHDYPSTRYSIEIARLAPRLSARQQKLALELLREMSEKPEELTATAA